MTTAAGKDTLEKLRLQISSFLHFSPSYDDANGFNLQRWINAFHGNLSTIVPKLENHLVNRKLLNMDDPDLARKWSRDELTIVRERRPYDPLMEIDDAFDRDGNLLHFAHLDPRLGPLAFRVFPSRRGFNYYLLSLENRLRTVQARERVSGKMVTCTSVYDTSDWSLKTFVEFAYHIPPLAKELESNYPGVVTKIIIINCPASVHAIFRVLSAVLPKSSTIYVIGKASPEPLLKLISSENLPVCYYGTRTDIARTYEESTTLPLLEEAKKDVAGLCLAKAEMCTVKVRAHGSIPIRIETKNEWQTIRWWFNAKNGPIDFAIYKGDGLELRDLVVPKFTSHTHHVAEVGDFKVEEVGVYTVVFASSSNYFAAVTVDYKIDLS